MSNLLRKTQAFVVRDFRIETSYKLNFFLRALNSLVPLVFFYYLSEMVEGTASTGLERFGGTYFPFVLVGLAFHRYLQLSLRMCADSIYYAQVAGSLEAMLGTQTRPTTIVSLTSVYWLGSTFLHLVLIFVVAVLACGLDLSQADYFAAGLAFLLSTVTFVSFGILAAASIVFFKRGDPVTWVFSTLGVVLGGAYFPIEVLPEWLQRAAQFIPITHSLEALRLSLLQGKGVVDIAQPLAVLGIMAAVLLPTSLHLFSRAVMHGRKSGTLMQH